MTIFVCTQCGKLMDGFLPKACECGFLVPIINGVHRFTDDIPFSTTDGELKWLGYEQIGESYEPGYLYNKKADTIGSSSNLADFLGENRVVLDIGAGLGPSAISFALAGLNVIAADISQTMLETAVIRAKQHNVTEGQIIFARMNGYNLALADNSVDAVLEVDMLFQVDRPELVMAEILRVLKPDGYFLQYGAWATIPPYTNDEIIINTKYDEAKNDIQDYYDKTLIEAGFKGPLFSTWEQAAECKKNNFELHTTLHDTGCYDAKNLVWTMEMGLHKTKTRASGGKQLIPDEIHESVWAKTHVYAKEKYGNDYENMQRSFNNRSGILVYVKR